jgi:uncharacterized protein (DUF2236 family)
MVAQLIGRRLDAFAGALMSPPPGLEFDYARPPGEPALVAPNSVSWRVFKNPVALFAGGVAAVILELAEPSVRSGVWDHSGFRRDPALRLRRTGAAAMMTVYGPRPAAESMIARVSAMHAKVRGTTPGGAPYRADDPRLLDWVQATAVYGFVHSYHVFVAPLSRAEQSEAFAEGREAARLYGARGAPGSLEDWEALLARTMPALEPSPVVGEFLAIMRSAPILPVALRPLQRLLVAAAVDLVPPPLQHRLRLGRLGLSAPERLLVRGLGALSDRLPIESAPPAQACLRMGLPADWLYRRPAAALAPQGSS